jgi:hypothetical protein
MKYQGITEEKKALEAVRNDGYALQYVLILEIFEKLAKPFNL